MKRIFSSILCGLLVASVFAGCGNNGGSSSSGSSSTPVNSDSSSSDNTGVTMSAPGEYPIVNEKVTYTVMAPQTNYILDLQTNAYTQWLEEKTNVHIEYETVPEAALTEKVNLSLASSEIPDAYLSCNIDSASQVKYGKEGVFVDMAPMIEQYGYEIPKAYEANNLLPGAVTTPDGEIFALAGVNECYHCLYCGRAWINQTWLDNLGLDYPETTEDFVNVLRAFKEQDANGNGDPNDEIPFTGIGLGMDFLSPFGMTDVYGQRYLVNDDGTVRYAYTTEEYKEGIKWAHKLYQDGLIDNELFTQNDQIRDAKCDDPNVSRVGFCYAWSYDAIFRNWKDEYKVIAPIAGPDGQRYQQGDLNGLYSLKSNQLSITTVCKHPEVVLRWADQFYTGEASIQNFWGGLGEVTTANADGTYTLNNPPAGTSADAWYWDRSLRDFGPKYCSIEFDKKIILDPTEGDGLKVAMDAETAQYVRPCFPELKYTSDEYNELSFLQADIDTYVDTTRAHWVADGGIDEEWDAYVEQLKTMGLEDMNKIYEGAYARYLAAQD